jgi:hypothetical protein
LIFFFFFMYDAFRWTEIQVGKNHESIIASFISRITRKQGGAAAADRRQVGSRRAATSEVMLGGGQRATLLRAVGWRSYAWCGSELLLVGRRGRSREQLGDILVMLGRKECTTIAIVVINLWNSM